MAEMEPPHPVPPEPPAPAASPSPRRTRIRTLLAFLGAFLLILFLFRGVLFPFLMAMFLAYLIEPVVAAFTKAPVFGVRWTRGPTIVVMYVVLIGGIVLLASCAVGKMTTTVESLRRDVSKTLHQSAERARFRPPEVPEGDGTKVVPFAQDVVIPAKTRVVLVPQRVAAPAPAPVDDGAPPPEAPPAPAPAPPARPIVFSTVHAVTLRAGESEAAVLLEPSPEEIAPDTPVGRILNPEGIHHPDGKPVAEVGRLRVESIEPATGLLLFIERSLVSPIVENLGKAGFQVQPNELRDTLAAQVKALGEDLPAKVTRWTTGFVAKLALGIYQIILILMLTAFIVMDRKRISRFFASLPPERHRDEYLTLVRYVDRGLAGVIRGQLVICAANGVLTYIGLLVLGIKWAEILALIAGVLSLIPIFGTIVSSIPIVLIGATDGIDKGLLALAWIAFIHLLEANVLNPLIMGAHARMHPVIIIFALLAGEHSFGVWGALLAVPTASIIQSCFQFYRHEIEGVPWDEEKPHGEWLRNVWRRILRRKPASASAGAPP
jgi:predicted PurR-regulated permease PerM